MAYDGLPWAQTHTASVDNGIEFDGTEDAGTLIVDYELSVGGSGTLTIQAWNSQAQDWFDGVTETLAEGTHWLKFDQSGRTVRLSATIGAGDFDCWAVSVNRRKGGN